MTASPRSGGGQREAGRGAPKGAPTGPRRPTTPHGQSSQAPGKGENRPSPNLVHATLLGSLNPPADPETGEVVDGPIKGALTVYPDGGELYAVPFRRSSSTRDAGAGEMRTYMREVRELGEVEADRRADERRRERAERSASESSRRSRSKVRKIVRTHGLDHMVTFTFPGDGVHDYDRSLRLLQHFLHDHGDLVRLGGHYVAVPELHPGGHGWHWHLLVCRRFTKLELHAARVGWTEYLRRKGMHPTGGARWVRFNVKSWGSATEAAVYAAKYVGKTFENSEVGKGRRRYLVSLGAAVERVSFNADSLEHVRRAVQAVVPEAVVLDSAEADGRPPILWASW